VANYTAYIARRKWTFSQQSSNTR